jgi:hypothetical protein
VTDGTRYALLPEQAAWSRAKPTMPKCFVLSLHRCGTSSATVLLERLGYRTIHSPRRFGEESLKNKASGRETELDFVMETITPALDHYDAASDIPIPVLYRQLQTHYPDSKWLLYVRDPHEWVRSIRRHVGERHLHSFERIQYWKYFPECPPTIAELGDTELARMFERHTDEVTTYARSLNPDKLGIFTLSDSECANRTAAFLGASGNYRMPALRNPMEVFRKTQWARIWLSVERAAGLGPSRRL